MNALRIIFRIPIFASSNVNKICIKTRAMRNVLISPFVYVSLLVQYYFNEMHDKGRGQAYFVRSYSLFVAENDVSHSFFRSFSRGKGPMYNRHVASHQVYLWQKFPFFPSSVFSDFAIKPTWRNSILKLSWSKKCQKVKKCPVCTPSSSAPFSNAPQLPYPLYNATQLTCAFTYFFIGNSIVHLSLELLTKFRKMSPKVA